MMGYKKLLLPVALTSVTMATALAFGPARPPAAHQPLPEERLSAPTQTATAPAGRADTAALPADEYVHREGLWPQLRSALAAMGDRLERPGKERLVMTGTLTRAGDATPTEFRLVREFPDRLRLETGTDGGQSRGGGGVYDGRAGARDGVRPRREADDIETLVCDTAEHFFTAHAGGAAIRHLGDRFRLDTDSDAALKSSSYNLYEITDDADIGGVGVRTRRQIKVYAFNSDTLLLERVRYETKRDGEMLRVEVRFDDWRREEGQMIPRRIERRENDRVAFALDINSVTVGPKQDDGAFTETRAN